MALGTLVLGGCQTMDNLVSDIKSLDIPLAANSEPTPEDFIKETECAQINIVDDLRFLSEFSDPDTQDEANLISRANIKKVETDCTFKDKSMTVDLTVHFEGYLGDHAKQHRMRSPYFSYPFFVAILSPSDEILAKEIFSAAFNYSNNNAQTVHIEKIRQIIPLRNASDRNRYKIMLGFQLEKEQLAYNRRILEKTNPAPTGSNNVIEIR